MANERFNPHGWEDDESQTSFESAPKPKYEISGAAEPLVGGLGAGLAGLPKQLITDPLRALGILDTPTQQELRQEPVETQPQFSGTLPRWLYQAAEMLPASLAPTLMGAGTGALVGGIPGAVVGGVAGGLGGAGLFGLSQAQSTKEGAIRQGVDPGMAPLLTGLTEGGLEALSNLVLGGIAGKLIKEPLRQTGKALLAPIAKNVAQLGIGEVLPEMAQAGIQAGIEKGYGIRPDANPVQEALDVIGPTALMSLMAGGGMSAASRLLPGAEKTMPTGYGEQALGTPAPAFAQPTVAESPQILPESGYPIPQGILDAREEPRTPWGGTVVLPKEPQEPDAKSIVLPSENMVPPPNEPVTPITIKEAMTEGKPVSNVSVDLKSGERVGDTLPKPGKKVKPVEQVPVIEEDKDGDIKFVARTLEDLIKQTRANQDTINKLQGRLTPQDVVQPVSIDTLPSGGNIGFIKQTPVSAPQPAPKAAPVVEKAKPSTEKMTQRGFPVALQNTKTGELISGGIIHGNLLAERNIDPEDVGKGKTWASGFVDPVTNEFMSRQKALKRLVDMDKADKRAMVAVENAANTAQATPAENAAALDSIAPKPAKKIIGYSESGEELTPENFKDVLAKEAANKLSEAAKGGRLSGITMATQQTYGNNHPNMRIVKEVGKSLGNNESATTTVSKGSPIFLDVAQKYKALGQNKTGMDSKNSVIQISPDRKTRNITYLGNSIEIHRDDTIDPNSYTVTVRTTAPAAETVLPSAPEVEKLVNVAAKKVIKQNVYQPEANKEHVHSPSFAASEKAADRNARSSNLSGLGNISDGPAIAVNGNMVHTPSASYRIEKRGITQVRDNTPEDWMRILNKYSPDSKRSNITTNRQYREQHVVVVGNKPTVAAKPVPRSEQRAIAPKPVPKSETKKQTVAPKKPAPERVPKARESAMSDLEKQAEWIEEKKRQARVKEGTSSEQPVAKKVEPEKIVFGPKSIKFEGRTISTDKVQVTFPKDVEKGSISIKTNGIEVANLLGTKLANPESVAKRITQVIAQQHDGVNFKEVNDLILKEMTGEKESVTKAEGTTKAKETKESQEEKVVTRADYVEKRFGRQLTLEEFAAVIPKEGLGTKVLFLNHIKRAMGLDQYPAGWDRFYGKNAKRIGDLYSKETSKRPRLVQQTIADIRSGRDIKSNWLGRVVDQLTHINPRQAVEYVQQSKFPSPGEISVKKMSNAWFNRHGIDPNITYDNSLTPEQKVMLEMFGRLFKKEVIPFKGREKLSGVSYGGKVFINSKLIKGQNGMDTAFHTTLAHEFVHELKKDYPVMWDKLKAYVFSSNNFQDAMSGIERYTGNNYMEAIDELVSDAASKFLLDKTFWEKISQEQPTVFEKLVGIIKGFIRKVRQNLKFTTQFGDQAVRDRYGEMIRKSMIGFETIVSETMAEYSLKRNNMFKIVDPIFDKRLSALSLSKVLPSSFKTWFRKSVLTENGRPRTMFHGSVNEIGNFITNRLFGSMDQRLGAHFAFDPKLADQFSMGQYTNFSGATNKDNLLFDTADNSYHLPGGRVYPVVVRAENPLDLSDSKHEDWKQIQFDAYDRLFTKGHKKQLFIDTYSTLLGMDPKALNDAWNHMVKTGEWNKFFNEYNLPHLQEINPSDKKMVDAASKLAGAYKSALKAAGYDSVIYKHTDQSIKLSDPRAIIVFDSDQVKSIYDTNPDGEIPKGLWLGGQMMNRNVQDITVPRSVNPIADAEFEKSRGLGTISTWDKIKQYGKDTIKDFTRQFVHLDPAKWGDVANTLYKFKYSGEYGQKIAIDQLRDVVRGLTPNRYNLFRRMIVMPDLINYIHNAQNNPKFAGKPIMGYNNAAEAQQDYARFKQAANSDPLVTAALNRRKQMMEDWRRLMVASKILPAHVLDARRQDYFRHQVLDWMGAKALGEEPTLMLGSQGESVRLRKAGWQRARKGSLHSYNTEYLEAEYEVLAQGYQQLEAKAALEHLKSYDKWKEFHDEWKAQSTDPDGESDFKLFVKAKGYDFWQPRKGNFLHKAWTLTDKALDRVMAEQRDEFVDPVTGELRPTQDLNESTRGLNRETVQGMPLPTWVLPDPVVKQLNQLEPPADDSVLAKATAKTLGWWKQWVLFNPLRLTKYVFNNTSGDLDIALAYDPKILKFSKQAAIDLWKYTNDPGTLSPTLRADMENALRQRVIDAGITFEEIGGIGTLSSSDIFKYLDDKHVSLWKKFSGSPSDYMNFVKKWANYRENILRLAAYRYFQQRVASGQPVYAASNKNEIDSISNADDKAAKLARELIGDYGNISRAGQWIRRHMIPFWSWMEINAPRYLRILHNTRYEGEITGNVGVRAALVGTKKVAVTAAKASALFAAINLFNKVMFPDEDDELRKTGRGQLHLILGRREDGTIRTLRIQGALSDALSWLGLENFGSDFRDLVSGKKDLLKQLKETAIAPAQRILLGARPIERTLSEMALGKTMWPDLTNPRPIRDPYEHFFKSVSMDLPYRYVVGKPVKGLEGDVENLLFYRADTGEAAYYKVMQKAREFLKEHNVELPSASPTKRSNALYYYKQAKKFGDKDAEKYWLEQFKEQGGKLQNVLQSIKKAHPMAFMPTKYRGLFMSGLDGQDKDMYNMAVNWWHKTYLSK